MSETPINRRDLELARLRWRCRRGTRELDLLLLHYLHSRYWDAGRRQRQAFVRLLEMPDPVILSYLMGRAEPREAMLADVVHEISACGIAAAADFPAAGRDGGP